MKQLRNPKITVRVYTPISKTPIEKQVAFNFFQWGWERRHKYLCNRFPLGWDSVHGGPKPPQ